ncbi:YybH family protein [Aliiglaciecola sp. M165]|uniref:YybH family protein n=1 Tax=Aliiglaciecola sp. M165 TaxID=2593649 RepID=UPI00117C381F|nr:nuclear transport factor 2 family protein [Aliiglaciecola sp. M165]TRY33426.1 nuclear transport factor 2 family protein [Aliiglaciecola sp. M165]
MKALISMFFVFLFMTKGYANGMANTITQEDVTQLLQNWKVAFATKDSKLLAQILDDSWVYSGGADGQTSGKEDSLNELANSDYRVTDIEFSDLVIRYYDDIAIVTAKEKLHILGADGALSFVNLRFTDVYRKQDGVTRAISTHSSPITSE